MKRLFSLFLALTIFVGIAPAVYAAEGPVLSIEADVLTAAPGESVTVTVAVDRTVHTYCTELLVTFSSGAYSFVSASVRNSETAVSRVFENEDGTASLKLMVLSLSEEPVELEAGALAEFTFAAKCGLAPEAEFSLQVNFFEDENEEPFDYSLPVPSVSVPVTAAHTPGGEYIFGEAPDSSCFTCTRVCSVCGLPAEEPVSRPWGDVNGDGDVDEQDVQEAAGLTAESDPAAYHAADVDMDGTVTALDLTALSARAADENVVLPHREHIVQDMVCTVCGCDCSVVITTTSALIDNEQSGSVAKVSGAGRYEIGASVTVTASEKRGFEFVAWYENGEPVSSSTVYTFVADTDHHLTAMYRAVQMIPFLLKSRDVCSVNGRTRTSGYSGSFAAGTLITVKYVGGGEFLCWKNAAGRVVSTSPEYTFALVSATSLYCVVSVGSAAVNRFF